MAEKEYPPIDKIEGANATISKQSPFKKFFNNFFEKDLYTVCSEFVENTLKPQLKFFIIDSVTSFLENWLGTSVSSSSKSHILSSKKTDYNGISKKSSNNTMTRSVNKDIYDVPEIVVPDRATAEQALYKCREYLREYDAVPVDRLLDCLDITGDFVDTKYGWKNLDHATVKHTRDGWVFILPEPEYIGNK